MESLGKRIKELRQKRGWTQADLAEKLGVSTSAVGMYEQGRREPDHRVLTELARVFGVTVDYLLSDGDGPRELRDALSSMRNTLAESGGLMFNGRLLDERDTDKLFSALMLAANLMLNSDGED